MYKLWHGYNKHCKFTLKQHPVYTSPVAWFGMVWLNKKYKVNSVRNMPNQTKPAHPITPCRYSSYSSGTLNYNFKTQHTVNKKCRNTVWQESKPCNSYKTVCCRDSCFTSLLRFALPFLYSFTIAYPLLLLWELKIKQ